MEMNMVYQTKRLELKILTEAAADMVLQFYLDNQEVFEEYETDRPQQFYTEPFQRMLLQCEYNLAVKQSAFRFWVHEQGRPDKVVGTISFHDIKRGFYQSCEMGYKFDVRYWGRGYARESISKSIQVMFEEMKLHRIEAYVLPGNMLSQRLLKGMGFQLEGIKKQNVKLHGVWKDHELYALLAGGLLTHSDNGTSNQIPLC